MTRMSNYQQNLNPSQLAAVQHHAGPAIVLAGAGSGKTKVLTTRAACLIQDHNIPPESILLVTFTNKSAQEMKKRINNLTGLTPSYVGTFHSLCAKILRKEGYQIGLLPSYIIYDADDQLSLIKQIIKDKDIKKGEIKPQAAKATISRAKNEMLSPGEYENIASGSVQELTAQIFTEYEKRLRAANAVDFDDLLIKTVQLLKNNPDVLSRYQKQFVHVLVDEYQDTNKAQYQLIKLLSQPQNNVFVVGDFSQSIYAWRGADYRNLIHFKKDFPNVTEYRLEQNYRSTQSILDIATAVISRNKSHPILELWTENKNRSQSQLYQTETQNNEAQQIADLIRENMNSFRYSQMAVLYRTNAQSRAFEEEFLKRAIPYQLIGGYKFYERKEVKDVISYLRIAVNPADQVSAQRAMKLGKRRLDQFMTALAEQKEDHLSEQPPAKILEKILASTQYLQKYDPDNQDDLNRIENVQELINVAGQFTNTSNFLENIALIQDDYLHDLETNQNQHRVSLMSLHSAKGLEFEVVFMVGMEDGLLPHSRSFFDQEQMEEERRLCYVGITRAKQKLYFSFARHRFTYQGKSNTIPSRFLGDIPEHLLMSFGKDLTQSKIKPIQLDNPDLDMLLDDKMDIKEFLSR